VEESSELREARRAFEARLEQALRARTWGESLEQDFREVVGAVRNIAAGDDKAAAAGLTAALRVPELAWARPEIHFGRSRVRYRNGDFDGALEDLDRVKALLPAFTVVYRDEAAVRIGEGDRIHREGGDPRPAIRAAIAALTEGLRLTPGLIGAYPARAMAHCMLAEADVGKTPRRRSARAFRTSRWL
jgi:hypothetical protein